MTKDRRLAFASIVLAVASIALRYLALPFSNDDMNVHNLVWYETLVSQGGWNALGTPFTNYSPPYSYMLAFASLFREFIAPLTAVKLIPIAFDVMGAAIVYKIVHIHHTNDSVPLLAASTYFAAPTVILNSSYWGQVDSLYAVFILACVYFLLTARHALAWISLGISFAVKAQAAFIAPLFLVLLLQKRIRWRGLAWMPAIYILSALPVILLGRSALDAFTVYLSQSGTYETLSRNAPNVYMFVPQDWYSVMLPAGVILAGSGMAAWAVSSAKYSAPAFINKNIAFHALVSIALTPFLLPKMHDRYFYAADVLSIVVAFIDPKLWFVPFLFQAVSLPGYAVFLFDGSQTLIYAAAVLNTLTIAFLLKRQLDGMDGREAIRSGMKRALSIIVASIVPIILIGAGMRSVFTPAFIRGEYFLLKNQAVERLEMYQRDVHITEYITGDKGENHLRQLQDGKGNPILDRADRQTLNRIRTMTEAVFDLWRFSLPFFIMMSALFWVYGNWSAFMEAVGRGGILTLWMAPVTGLLIAGLAWGQQPTYRLVDGAAVGIFSSTFWLIAAVWVASTSYLAGLLAAKLHRKTGENHV